jgi:hypothetical protein
MPDTGMMKLIPEAAIVSKDIWDERGRFFDHELTAEKEAIPKHPPGISTCRRRSGQTAQQRANEGLHDAPPGVLRSGLSL